MVLCGRMNGYPPAVVRDSLSRGGLESIIRFGRHSFSDALLANYRPADRRHDPVRQTSQPMPAKCSQGCERSISPAQGCLTGFYAPGARGSSFFRAFLRFQQGQVHLAFQVHFRAAPNVHVMPTVARNSGPAPWILPPAAASSTSLRDTRHRTPASPNIPSSAELPTPVIA